MGIMQRAIQSAKKAAEKYQLRESSAVNHVPNTLIDDRKLYLSNISENGAAVCVEAVKYYRFENESAKNESEQEVAPITPKF